MFKTNKVKKWYKENKWCSWLELKGRPIVLKLNSTEPYGSERDIRNQSPLDTF